MQTAQFNDLHYKMIGRLLTHKRPHLAQSLIYPYLKAVPYDTDFKKIDSYYLDLFCKEKGIEKSEITGALFKSSKVDVRRLFIASMAHIYYPHIYHQHTHEINLSKKGFVTYLAKALKQQESNVSVVIREVVTWEKEYDDFKEKVVDIVEKLKNVA